MVSSAAVIFACFVAATGPASGAEERPPNSPAMNGVITGIKEDGRTFSMKSRTGEERVIELPPGVKVIRSIGFSSVKEGDRIYAILGDVDGEMLVRRAVINGEWPQRQGVPEQETSRVWGEVAEVDLEAGRIKIRTPDGKFRTVGVGDKVRINAFTGPKDLLVGDFVALISHVPFEPEKIMAVIVNPRHTGRL